MKYQIDAKNYGEYDVLVCGGGTAGCMAAIAAARKGARTLLIERSYTVGGMLTVGEAGITKFTEHCRDVENYKKEVIDVLGTENSRSVQVVGGIPHEFAKRLIENKNAVSTNGEAGSYVFTDKVAAQYTLIKMLDEAGTEVLYDTRVCLAIKEDNKLKGVVAVNKGGFFEIYAKSIVDATGDGDVAALAGAEFNFNATEQDINDGFGTTVGKGLNPGVMYRVAGIDFEKLFDFLSNNREYFHVQEFGRMSLEECISRYRAGEMFVFRVNPRKYHPEYDENDTNRTLIQIYNLPQKGEAILLGPAVGGSKTHNNGLDSRENSLAQHEVQTGVFESMPIVRNFPGFENYYVTYIPELGVRETRHIKCEYMLTVADVIFGKKFDDSIACGGHPIDTGKMPEELRDFEFNHWRFYIPYRIMLPVGIDNLLVAGRCVGATRGASGAIRPTAQCMAMGQASGTAAALSAKFGITPGKLNTEELRSILIKDGAII